MNAAPKALRAGVMGWPVAHSKSPAVHHYWLKQYAIDGSYVRLPVKPEHFKDALKALPNEGFAGVNVTVPHKQSAFEFVDEISDEARRIGAVNTIFVGTDGSLRATNTDAYGFSENLRAHVPTAKFKNDPAVVLGAGGAARAVCVALYDLGVPEIRLVNRTILNAQKLAEDLGNEVKPIPWEDGPAQFGDAGLLVNTTVLGMEGCSPLEIDLNSLPDKAVVADLVYAPLETPLLKAARARGLTAVDGLGMLLYQAQAGFEGWFGRKPEVTAALREHVLSAA